MRFALKFTATASAQMDALEADAGLAKRLKAVNRALGFLETNPRHQSPNTHKFSSLSGPNGEEVFEAYAESKTPAAYRIFWCYGPTRGEITLLAVTPHP
jgi:hypothetical protein